MISLVGCIAVKRLTLIQPRYNNSFDSKVFVLLWSFANLAAATVNVVAVGAWHQRLSCFWRSILRCDFKRIIVMPSVLYPVLKIHVPVPADQWPDQVQQWKQWSLSVSWWWCNHGSSDLVHHSRRISRHVRAQCGVKVMLAWLQTRLPTVTIHSRKTLLATNTYVASTSTWSSVISTKQNKTGCHTGMFTWLLRDMLVYTFEQRRSVLMRKPQKR